MSIDLDGLHVVWEPDNYTNFEEPMTLDEEERFAVLFGERHTLESVDHDWYSSILSQL